MWFDDQDVSGRRLFSKRRNRRRTPVLSVRARSSTKKKINTHRAGAFILVPAALVITALLSIMGVRALGRLLFSENDLFTVSTVDVTASSEAVRDLTREYTRISEGINIFGFSLGEVRELVLKRTPSFKDMTICRRLPGTVAIEVIERVPLARLGRSGPLVVDREGCVFALGAKADELPGLLGYSGEGVAPGDRVVGLAIAALQVLEVCDDPRLDLSISSIRVDDSEKIHLQITHEGRHREFGLTWDGMGEATVDSRRALIRKVIQIRRTLESDEGRSLTLFDATFSDRIYGR